MKERCEKMVSGEGQWGAFHRHQCHKKAVIERGGVSFCKIHNPERIEKRDRERWKKEAENHRRNVAMARACEGISTDLLELIRVPILIEAARGSLSLEAIRILDGIKTGREEKRS